MVYPQRTASDGTSLYDYDFSSVGFFKEQKRSYIMHGSASLTVWKRMQTTAVGKASKPRSIKNVLTQVETNSIFLGSQITYR